MEPWVHEIAVPVCTAVAAVASAVGAAISGGNKVRADKIEKKQDDITVLIDTGVKQQLEAHLIDDENRHRENVENLTSQRSMLEAQDKSLRRLEDGMRQALNGHFVPPPPDDGAWDDQPIKPA